METTGDTSSCSTAANTTDCLLDRLINIVSEKFAADDARTDWDPITFAFTVPFGVFGILATSFALIAIIQGIFAASPGRRKSSRQVIGEWAERTITRVSLRELRTYTQATTPHFTARKLLDMLQAEQQAITSDTGPRNNEMVTTADDNGTAYPVDWFKGFARRFPVRSHKIPKVPSQTVQTLRVPFAESSAEAGWLRLLSQFGIADLLLERTTPAVTAADYIPDDLRAVPAYADIRAIVVLAAVGGVHSFEPEIGSSYPLLIAPTFEIEFRQHPVLGRVAAFSGSLGPLSVDHQNLLVGLRHSDGHIECQQHWSSHGLSLISNNFLPVTWPDYLALEYLALHGQEEDCYGNLICRDISNRTFQQATSTESSHMLWLLAAKTPACGPALFPLHLLSISTEMTLLCLQSKFWAADKELQNIARFESILSGFLQATEGKELGNNDNGATQKFRYLLRTFMINISHLDRTKNIISVCVDFIHGNRKISSSPDPRKSLVLGMLKSLDKILEAMQTLSFARPRCQSTLLFVTTSLLFTFQRRFENEHPSEDPAGWKDKSPRRSATGTSLIRSNLRLLSSLDLFLGGQFQDADPHGWNAKIGLNSLEHWERLRKLVDQCKNTYQESNDHQASVEESAEQLIVELLILRAILVGVLFCSSPDISTIQRSPIWRHVIPVL